MTQELKIPVEALAINDATPDVGDEVDVSITGKVMSVSGNYARVQVTMIDGVESGDEPEIEPEADEEPEAVIARMKARAELK